MKISVTCLKKQHGIAPELIKGCHVLMIKTQLTFLQKKEASFIA